LGKRRGNQPARRERKRLRIRDPAFRRRSPGVRPRAGGRTLRKMKGGSAFHGFWETGEDLGESGDKTTRCFSRKLFYGKRLNNTPLEEQKPCRVDAPDTKIFKSKTGKNRGWLKRRINARFGAPRSPEAGEKFFYKLETLPGNALSKMRQKPGTSHVCRIQQKVDALIAFRKV
jgi:hypothetical protein